MSSYAEDDAGFYNRSLADLIETLRGLAGLKLADGAELPTALRAHLELVAVLGSLGERGIGPEFLPALVEVRDALLSIAHGKSAPIFRLPSRERGARGLDVHTAFVRSAAAVAVGILVKYARYTKPEALQRVSRELGRRGKRVTPGAIDKHRDQNRWAPTMTLANDRLVQIEAAAEARYATARGLGLTEKEAAEIAADGALDWAAPPPGGVRAKPIARILDSGGG